LFCAETAEHPEVLPQRGWGGSGSSVAERGRESGKTADPYEQLLAMILDFVTGEEEEEEDDDEKAPERWSPVERSPMDRPPGEWHRRQPGKLDWAEPTARTLKATPPAPVGQSTSGVRLERRKPETVEPLSVGRQKPVTPAGAPHAPAEEAGRLPTLTEEGCIELFIQEEDEEEEEQEEEGVGSDEDADGGRMPSDTQKVEHAVWAYTCGF